MQANVLDFRYKMKNILQALDRNETVTIMYYGKEKGKIIPTSSSTEISVQQHPFFGMEAGKTPAPVENTMEELRGSRY